VQVAGQPEPVPAEWAETPAGKFAHSLEIPNPISKDSGYRPGMTGEKYFDHLCKVEAGEFIYKTVKDVEGFYFMRPPNWPTDDDLKDRYKLEAPEIERTFQLRKPLPEERGKIFINPPWNNFLFVEEPFKSGSKDEPYLRVTGYRQDVSPMKTERIAQLRSRYGITWRGVRRPHDREHAIAGSEWIVIDLKTNDVIALQRDYGRTGFNRNSKGGIWWLNAVNCPNSPDKHIRGSRIYDFVIKSLKPVPGDKK
jgi:hypothetical protein